MIVLNEELTKENIYKYITSYEIFKTYSKNFKEVNKSFFSDFRKETRPSCQVTCYNGDLLYTDFGLGKSFRAINFVMYKFGLNYYEALEKINKDFNLNLGVIIKNKNNSNKIVISKPIEVINKNNNIHNKSVLSKIIKIKKRSFNTNDKEFWNKYGIKLNTLELFNVVPISHFWINSNMFYADKYAYSYNFKMVDKIFRRKIYQPFSKYKWLNNGGKIIQGDNMLPKTGDVLIITKALKDVMSLYELGFTSIAPPSESSLISKEYMNDIKKRFKQIYIFFDNDDAGIYFTSRFKEEYKLNKSIFIPKEYKVKDISDFILTYGVNKTKTLLNLLL